jgi:polygalacturonase
MSSAPDNGFFNILAYGAVGDGKSDCMKAFASAIDACSKAGGGTVLVPAGQFVSGSVVLKSNVTLNVTPGATILGSNDPDDFPPVEDWWSNNIHADGAENIAIVGGGVIDGRGQYWWERMRKGERKTMRPNLIGLRNCRNVLLRDVQLRNSPMWTVRPIFCNNVTVDRVSICNPANSPNTDGINPDSCSNVHISNCHIDVGDDCITIKSGKQNEPGRKGRPCENITVTNCTMIHGHGGVVLGSETAGGIKNVAISNCVFQDTDRGLRFKSVRGRGGVIEDVRITNIVMENVLCPFVINSYYMHDPHASSDPADAFRPQPVGEGTPVFRNIHFSNCTARNVRSAAGFVHGLPEMPVTGVTFDNIRIEMTDDPNNVGGQAAMAKWLKDTKEAGFMCYNVEDLTFRNVRIEGAVGTGLLVHRGKGITIENVEVRRSKTPDAKPIELKEVS